MKRVPLPLLAPSVAKDPFIRAKRAAALRRFATEIRRYETVSHPGIVRFLGVATAPEKDAALLVSELMNGRSLADALDALRLAKVPLTQPSFFRVAIQACGGLRDLHARGCTWGDAKPGNVLLSDSVDNQTGRFSSSAQARISDCGLSRIVEQNLLGDTTVEASGQPLGTYNYMPPERFSGRDRAENPQVAKAADMYSFGLVLYEMLTLRAPWKRRQMIEVVDKVQRGIRPSWPREDDEDYYSRIPEQLVALVEHCWAQNPNERPTADDVFNTLGSIRESLVRRESNQRPFPDLSGGSITETGVAQLAAMNPGMMVRASSKQSNASTAVAIGEVSVDLQSSGRGSSALNSSMGGLTSTRESARGGDLSDEDHNMSLTKPDIGAHLNSNPRVSPVTSPEPRSLANGIGNSQASNGVGTAVPSAIFRAAQINPAHETSFMAALVPEDEKIVVDRNKDGAFLEHGLPLDRPYQGQDAAGIDIEHRRSLSSPDVDLGKHRSDTDLQAVAKKFVEVEAVGILSTSGDKIHPGHGDQANVGNTIESNFGLTSSSASTVSIKRKRNRRVQTVIEQATEALLEARRQNDPGNKLPPKQRKEAADRRAVEEARLLAEHQAVQVIEEANAEGDFSTILEKMREYRDSLIVAKTGTSFLDTYCKTEAIYFEICEEGGIEELLSGIARFGEADSVICAGFCNCVTTLAEYFDDKVGYLLRATGVPSTVVDVLGYHRSVVPVQTAGCKALAAMAGSSELSRSAVATLGGPAAVYRALTQNNASFRDVDLARASLRAVRHIAQDNELAAQFLVNVVALDAVSRSAGVFTDDGLEADILHALRAFAFYNGGRRNIIMSSGLKALTEIMLRNREPDFLVRCCTFIREIARWRDVECEEAMLQSCIAERITTLMQESNDMRGEEGARVSWYASQACTFLASFGSRSRQRLRIVGAIDTAISILNHRRENFRVVKSATDALAELTKGEPEAKIHAERFGALPALNAALDLHGNNMRVRNALQWTIDCLSSTQGANLGPAQGSQVYQELVNNGSLPQGEDTDKRPKRVLGFKFLQFLKGKA